MNPRTCPSCDERLSPDADRCACGWVAPGGKRRRIQTEGLAPRHNMRCTWHVAGLTCAHPNAFFEESHTSGFCIFHRRTPAGAEAAAIAEESHHAGPERYAEMAEDAAYGPRDPETGMRRDNPNVAKLRQRLRAVADGQHVGLFASKVLGK